jgi:DNA-directed RNA polymerase beta' subunit
MSTRIEVNLELHAQRDVSQSTLAKERATFESGVVKLTQLAIFGYKQLVDIAVTDIDPAGYKNFADTNERGLSSIRMSAAPDRLCATCNMNEYNCRGHPGIIKFGIPSAEGLPLFPIYHPAAIRYVAQILSLFCASCGRLYFTEEEIKEHGYDKLGFELRLKTMSEDISRKTRKCRKSDHLAQIQNRILMAGLKLQSPEFQKNYNDTINYLQRVGADFLTEKEKEIYFPVASALINNPSALSSLPLADQLNYTEAKTRALRLGITNAEAKYTKLYSDLLNKIEDAGLSLESPETRNEYRFNFPASSVERDNPRECVSAGRYNAKVKDGTIELIGGDQSIPISPKQAYETLTLISTADAKLLGIDPRVHPRNYIMHAILVPGPKFMRSQTPGSAPHSAIGMYKEYTDIMKIIVALNEKGIVNNSSEVNAYLKKLYEHVKALVQPASTANQLSIQYEGIRKKLTGKRGLFRGNGMGKKGDYSGRGVISVDTSLVFGYAGVPRHHAETLTYRGVVRDYNYNDVLRLIEEGKVTYITFFSVPNGTSNSTASSSSPISGSGRSSGTPFSPIGEKGEKGEKGERFVGPDKREGHRRQMTEGVRRKYLSGQFTLALGDIFERHLMDDDYITLNRPPSLHKGSKMGFKVRITEGNTIKLHMYTTESFHADFDGDEMAIVSPQDISVVVEVAELMHANQLMMDPSNGKPNIAPVYDTLIAVNKLTRINPENGEYIAKLTFAQFCNCVREIDYDWDDSLDDEENLNNYLAKVNPHFLERARNSKLILRTPSNGGTENKYLGPLVLSILVPPTLQYQDKDFSIVDGMITRGTMKQKHIGFSPVSLVTYIYANYGVPVLSDFFTKLSWIANYYLGAIDVYSIGLADCLELKLNPVESASTIALIEADIAELGPAPQDSIRKARYDELISAKMSTLKAKGDQIITQNNMNFGNPLVIAADAGAKAKSSTLAQMASFLGPQLVQGQFMKLGEGVSDRPLAILAPGERSLLARSFAVSNYIDGVTPDDEIITLMKAREGPTNINNTTADTGFLQRRFVKSMEPYVLESDRVTKNTYNNSILEFASGDTNFNPEDLVQIKTKKGENLAFFINVKDVVNELNSEYGL